MKKILLFISLTCFAIALFTASFIFAAFDPHTPIGLTPHIGTVRIELVRTVNSQELLDGKLQMVTYMVLVEDQFDNHMDLRSGDLIPHLTTGQKNQLIAFMDSMWVKAETEILP